MSIKRYTKDFWYGTGSGGLHTKKNVVGSAFGAPQTLERISPQGGTETFAGGSITVSGGSFGTQFNALSAEFYFNTDAAVTLSEALKGSFSTIEAMASALTDYILTATSEGSYISFNSYNDGHLPDFPSVKQGLWFGSADGVTAPCAFFRGQATKWYDSVAQIYGYGVSLYIGVRPANWSENTGMWANWSSGNYNMEYIVLSYSGVSPAGFIEKAFKYTKNIKISPMVPPQGNYGTGAITGYTPSTTTAMVYFDNIIPFTNNGYAKVLSSGQFTPWFGSWTAGSGDVDPTDPWEEPDPYEPIPPGPTPPGPVDPVDPVDPVPEPDYPPVDGSSVGIYKIFKPSAAQLRAIAAKLWDPTAWDAIKQMFTNPMDALMGLAIVPVNPAANSGENVYLGRYNTEISVPRVTNEYVTVDCGSVVIPKFYGSYLDHDPYTKYTLYLPYIGELDISADEITGRTVSIKYHCNVVTGDTVAIVLIDNRSCYTAMGNIIRQLPLSQVDFSSVIQTAVEAAATVIQTATSVSSGLATEGVALASGNMGAAMGGYQRAANATAHGVASTLNNVANTKLAYKHAGKIGQGAAQMAVQKPFFTITRPNLSLPEGIDGARNSSQKRYTGYPANYIDELRNFHGLTIVEEAQLNLLGATDAEIAEAIELLKGGVYL